MQHNPNPWQRAPQWIEPAPGVPHSPDGSAPGPGLDGSVHALDAVKLLFRQPDWQTNLLVGAVFTLIPVIGPIALMGWQAEIVQRLARRHPRPVPKLDFSDLTHYLSRGVSPFVTSLVLVMPFFFVLSGLGAVAAIGAIAAAQWAHEPTVGILVAVVLSLVTFIASMVVGLCASAAITRAELTEQIGSSLSIGWLLTYVGRTWLKTITANLVYSFFLFWISLLGLVTCFVGLYPVMVIATTGQAHLRWQIYGYYLSKGGEPIPVKSPVTIPSEEPPRPQAVYPR